MPKFKLRLHCNFAAYKPVMEFDVHPAVAASTVHELFREVAEGALAVLEVEGPEGNYRVKRRFP
jgi:hypothetical protein